jgi:pyrimidine-specific ribonucleoside hydrolase
MLLRTHPDVVARVAQIILWDGSTSGGHATEFNVWQDPEAALCVIKSSIPTTMYGLDLFDRLKINEGAVEHFRTHDHPAIRLAGELLYRRRALEVKRDYAGPLGDAGAMVMLTNPELFVTEPLPV